MTADPGSGDRTLNVRLDAKVVAALTATAAERDLAPEDLVARWVQERLAHEGERRLGRERPQRSLPEA